MEIRSIQADDLEQLSDLYTHLNADDPKISSTRLESVWSQSISSGVIEYIGLFVEDKLVSSCQVVVVPNFTRAGLPYCLIENVVTHTKYQNKGYGKALLSCAIDFAWGKECYKVMLMSGRKSDAVLQFYKSVGFSSDEKTASIVRAECT